MRMIFFPVSGTGIQYLEKEILIYSPGLTYTITFLLPVICTCMYTYSVKGLHAHICTFKFLVVFASACVSKK